MPKIHVEKPELEAKEIKTILSLLVEYAGKMESLGKEVRERSEYSGIMLDAYGALISASEDLARVASQQIEYSKHDELARLELRLRLAELEGALRVLQR